MLCICLILNKDTADCNTEGVNIKLNPFGNVDNLASENYTIYPAAILFSHLLITIVS